MEIREVFEPVLNFIKNLQKKDKEIASKQAAKDRLKLVLMQDRASVSPDFFEMMKQEIIDVIKKYIEIDEESLEVQLTRGLEAGLEGPALYANIPIKNVKPVAPKAEGGEDIDELQLENNIATGMTEEEADKMADTILTQIECIANNEEVEEMKTDDSEEKEAVNENEDENTVNEENEIIEEIKEEENEKKETESAEKKKTTRRKTSTTATKKKTTASKVTKTTTRKKKSE